ncbi:MAG TPA: hypothetical protein VGF25_03865 [Thermoleophilaceae bacterium]
MGLFRRKAAAEHEEERCPYCREPLPEEASRCLMCGSNLPLRASGERRVPARAVEVARDGG